MLEHIKTGLLIALVIISISLSFLIWQGLPPAATSTNSSFSGGTFWGPGIDVQELMVPARIIVHLGEDKHSVLYPETDLFNQTWHPLLDVLQQLGGYRGDQLKMQSLNEAKWGAAQESMSIELVFDYPADTELWGQILGYDQVPSARWPVKRMLFVVQPKPELFLASSTGEDFVQMELPGGNKLELAFQQLSLSELSPYTKMVDIPALSWGLFLPEDDLSYPVLRLRGEDLEPKAVAGSFFADLSLTRRINERDGATIYSDGRRGVRVWSQGRVEYSAPEVLYGVRLPWGQALKRAVRFVTQHGGWPVTMRLTRLQEITADDGRVFYNLAFRQYEHGLPLATAQIELELSDRGVASYRREVWLPSHGSRMQLLSPAVASTQVAELIAEGKQLIDVYPGYVIETNQGPNPALYPVWLAELADGRVMALKPPK
jgi:regulatory protein YycH of two-component signal transduction system YycFG